MNSVNPFNKEVVAHELQEVTAVRAVLDRLAAETSATHRTSGDELRQPSTPS